MRTFYFCWVLLLVLQVQPQLTKAVHNESQTYIIHINHSHKPSYFPNHESWHKHMVKSLSLVCPEDNEALHVYSYTHATQGFSAKLTPCQLAEVEKSPAHLTTLKESFGQMLTTHTPRFLGLNRSLGIWPTASFGDDVIIGVFDTGIWPESESFSDDGMSNIPVRWKGKCENGTEFTPTLCNNKLIGAKSFKNGLDAAGISISSDRDFDSPRDGDGHGTHTSLIAGGNFVCGASHFGYAKGVAIGIAPRAHLAMYKVIWSTFDMPPASSVATDILAGMDQAISDGVDVMSISLALIKQETPLYEDVIAIASFSAPWIITVGAGTIDRSFVATLELGNGLKFQGTSYFPSSVSITNTDIYYAFRDPRKSSCFVDLDPSYAKGKIVLCDDSGKSGIPVDFGAGHINPNRAMDPGLIFDLGSQDYIDFLCGLGYSPKQMMSVIRRNRWICNDNKTDLNYPSFMASFTNQSTFPFEKHFTRTVTNVGEPESTYQSVLDIPDGMVVKLEPSIIRFTSKYQKQDFALSLQAVNDTAPKVKYGYLKWVDEHNHTVSSPIVVTIQ